MSDQYLNFIKESAKRRKQAYRMYGDGKTQGFIANKFGVSRQRVGQWIKQEAKKHATGN